jgi:SAM-dependent methyltransferase
MEQTPVHESHNEDLLKLIPTSAARLIEVGCSSGALAREFLKMSPSVDYVGVDIDKNYAQLAKRYCQNVYCMDIEQADDDFWIDMASRDCWIFGDCLEHLRDPWSLLKKVRSVVSPNAHVVACIPNAQHWSVQARLAIGDFRYQDRGLLDRTHLRWFTRQTIVELFSSTGFSITQGVARIFPEPASERFLPLIAELARAAGGDAATAMEDAKAMQYVVCARPT